MELLKDKHAVKAVFALEEKLLKEVPSGRSRREPEGD